MKKLTQEEILRVAKLAQIEIPANEIEVRLKEFNDVLAFTEKLNELDVAGIDALGQIMADQKSTPMVPDVIVPSFEEKTALSNAPDRQDFFFKVPRMIGETNS